MGGINPRRLLLSQPAARASPCQRWRELPHPAIKVEIMEGDLVIISASPIPGNEKLVYKVIDDLFKQGAYVIYDSLDDIHVSGHAKQEELNCSSGSLNPNTSCLCTVSTECLRACCPCHEPWYGQEQHIYHAERKVLELTSKSAAINGNVPSGSIMVDGLGVGDVGDIVLRDRKILSEDGLIIIVSTIDPKGNLMANVEVMSRGFVYVKESEELIEEVRTLARDALVKCVSKKAVTGPPSKLP